MSFLEIIVVGNLGRDAEFNYAGTGTAVCKFSIAVNRRVKQGDQWADETQWMNITLFGNRAENIHQYLTKGKQVLVVSDSLEVRPYTTKDGQLRANVDLIARDVRFLGTREGAGAMSSGGGRREESYSDGGPENSDDIPF